MRSQAVAVSGKTKLVLDALVALKQRGPASLVSEAILCFVGSLPDEERSAVESIVSLAMDKRVVQEDLPKHHSEPKVTYKYSKLAFKRKVIESLAPSDEFRVDTPFGSFQMSRLDFEADFGGITKTATWKRGYYPYPLIPSKAEKYRITNG